MAGLLRYKRSIDLIDFIEGKIKTDGFSRKTLNNEKCGASGGTIRLKAEKVSKFPIWFYLKFHFR